MAESLERPNLVFITTDQHRGDCTGIDGHPILETPHLDQLANEGVYFPRAYSPCPVCVPARMVMMTGQSPYNTGFFTNSSSALGQTDTLPRILGGLGYQTQLIGKAHFSPQRARLGFDNTIINESGRYREGDDYHLWLNKTPYAGLERATSIGNNDVFSRRSVVPETHHVNTWTANECIEFLDRRDPTCPFFLWMSFSRPHSQYDPPAPYDAWYDPEDVPPPIRTPDEDFLPPELREAPLRYDWDRMPPARIARARQHYFGQITHIDHQIGRFLAVLRWKGLWDNTLVIFTSDHGDMMGDHGLFFKSHFFEGSGRVPLILRAPRGWEGAIPAQRYGKPVSLVDVLPTLVSAAGGRVSDRADGVSLLPVLGGGDPVEDRIFHGEIGGEKRRHHCLTDGRYKYMWFRLGGCEYLFDLKEDPNEVNNLARDEDRVVEWRNRLIKLLEVRGDQAVRDGALLPTTYEPTPEAELRANDPFGRRPY
jgi:choline-sulfatase